MSLTFRNLTTDPSEPVSHWPTEAVQTALERGDLADWHRLAAEVAREPWGRTARQLEEVLSYSRPYGIAEAMEEMIARARTGLNSPLEATGSGHTDCECKGGVSCSQGRTLR